MLNGLASRSRKDRWQETARKFWVSRLAHGLAWDLSAREHVFSKRHLWCVAVLVPEPCCRPPLCAVTGHVYVCGAAPCFFGSGTSTRWSLVSVCAPRH
jgi:hypothetical protein